MEKNTNSEARSIKLNVHETTGHTYLETLYLRSLMETCLYNQAIIMARLEGKPEDKDAINEKYESMLREADESYNVIFQSLKNRQE